jgi:hypothetical protein
MSTKAIRFNRTYRPYLSKELQTELDEFFAEHPELDRAGSMESWIRKGVSEHRKHGHGHERMERS